jgi:exonuclease SbcC
LDYHTFINSALLLQGHADEFSKSSPSERKKVLGNILNLSLFDEAEEQARELAKQKEIERRELENSLRAIEAELAQKESYQAELQEVKKALLELQSQMETQEKVLAEFRQTKKELDLKQEQIAETENRIAQAEREINYLQAQLTQHRKKVAQYEAVLVQSKEIEVGYGKLFELRNDNEELEQKLLQRVAIIEQINQLERAIERAKGELITEQAVLQRQIQRLTTESETVPRLEQELHQTKVDSAKIDKLYEELEQKRLRRQELSNQIHHLSSINAQLEQETEELKSKLELLSRGDSRCPLCETELGTEGRERIIAKYEQERHTKAKIRQANASELRQKEAELQTLKGEVAQLEQRINRERTAIQARQITLNKDIAQAKRAAIELVADKACLSQLKEQLERSDFALQEQKALRELQLKLDSIGYDAQRHRSIRGSLVELGRYESLKRSLDEAKNSMEQEKASLVWVEEGLSRWHSDRDAESKRWQALAEELKFLPELAAKLEGAESNYSALLSRQANSRQTLGAVQQKLEHCAYLEKVKKERSKQRDKAAEEKGIYEELAAAFGKKGVQALIIEQVLPELEEEANRLLGRMTDNRMSLRLETQRQSKKGETIETLGIRISDELGTRSYEMFSGGEAFRIDFALRIALSKLLARRAGAPLPTLFIDEGFGTQDSAGREKLVEAINSIQDDFDKIIVITHIEELRDAFPVRIEVTKTATGSMLSVS